MTNVSKNYCSFILLLTVFIIASLFASCHSSKPPVAKRYPLTGRVVSIDSKDQSAVIDAEAIPGFMEAMAMPYTIKPAEVLSQLSPGDSIAAEVVVMDNSGTMDNASPGYWLENVRITGHGKTPPSDASGTSQRIPEPGDEVPDFQFTNQSGKRISVGTYRGKVVVITFIYTRCPFPDFCPRMSSNFAEIDKQIRSDPSLHNIHLLTLSFDPEHDTARALRDYGFSVGHTHDAKLFDRWEFAAPNAADLPKVAGFFGVIYKPESGMITHNLSTTVVGPDGKIVKWYHGSDWQISDLIKDARGAKPRG